MFPVSTDSLLLVLSDSQTSSAAHLATASGQSPAATLRHLQRLIEHEVVAVADYAGHVPGYRLAPLEVETNHRDRCRHTLLVEGDPSIAAIMTALFEFEGLALVVCETLTEAGRLLDHVRFDLVLTDSFSRTPAGVVTATAGVVQAAGGTPVVLFTAHRMEREAVLGAGFRDLISKPFDLETLLHQVHTLLRTGAPLLARARRR